MRQRARQTLSRVAGAPLVGGNAVELLIDGRANFEAWASAITTARSSIFLENYIFDESDVSHHLRDALSERAAAGVRVTVIRDWLGCLGASRSKLWRPLCVAGGEVRVYNPFRLTSPFGWLPRDHRKLLVVDDEVAFVSGVCVSQKWLGDPARGIDAWRDTGVAVRGPAVHDVANAFAESWARLGPGLAPDLPALRHRPHAVGNVSLRVIASSPGTTGLYRHEQLIAAIAQRSLWLTDAYFVGLAPYVQALTAAARDGVDVRLLVPGTSDLPAVGALSRAGYRPLLEAGVRVYEWNGSMLHAKTAVADGRWTRIGSSNLNIASWMGNSEIDVSIEDDEIGRAMELQYERDLLGATEILLHATRHPVRRSLRGYSKLHGAGSGRAAAGAMRLASTVGAAMAGTRVLAPVEGDLLLGGAAVLAGATALALYAPRAIAWPLAALAGWSAIALLGSYVRGRRAHGCGVPAASRSALPWTSSSTGP